MSRSTHATGTLWFFGCTSLALLAGACGGGSGGSRYISVSWSVTDLATGLQANCDQLASYGVDIVQTDDSIVYFTNQGCQAGVMSFISPNLQKGVYTGSLELLAPNGTVLSQGPSSSFDVTQSGTISFNQSFQVDDVCKHNRYFSLAWTVDNGAGTAPFNCNQSAAYSVSLAVTNPPATFALAGSCDDSYRPNWYGASEDGVPPGSYSVTASLLDSGGNTVSQTPMQLVTVNTCSPGAINGQQGTAFGLR